jgi:hypothetical protein
MTCFIFIQISELKLSLVAPARLNIICSGIDIDVVHSAGIDIDVVDSVSAGFAAAWRDAGRFVLDIYQSIT